MKIFLNKILVGVVVLTFNTLLGQRQIAAQNDFGGIISFDKVVHNFGDILLSDGEQHCTFTYKNIGDKPIVVHRVITSCGCTEPNWDKKPIHPGESGKIDISFKNDQGPYPFDKGITVYVSDLTKPIVLRIRGVAHNKKRSLEEMFPHKIGALGVKSTSLSLGQIEQGLSRNETIEVANLSNKKITISFEGLTPGLSIDLSPKTIAPKGKAQLTYIVDTKKTPHKIWGKSLFKANVLVNGVVQEEPLVVETLIKENFSNLTEEQIKVGPLPKMVYSSLSFGKCKMGEKKILKFPFTNMGKGALHIYKVDSDAGKLTFDFSRETPPNGKGEVEVTVETGGEKGEVMYVVSIITNSPIRPIVNIFITGEII